MKTTNYGINAFSATILTLAVAICGCGKPGAAPRNAAGTNDPASQKDVATAIPDNSQTRRFAMRRHRLETIAPM